MRSIHWATPPCSHTQSSLQFSYPSIILLLSIGLRRWVAFWKALEQLYRLVVVSRHNINHLSIDSTREGVRIRIWRSKSASKIRILTKEKEVDTFTSPPPPPPASLSALVTITSSNPTPSPSGSLVFIHHLGQYQSLPPNTAAISNNNSISYQLLRLRLTRNNIHWRRWWVAMIIIYILFHTQHPPPPSVLPNYHFALRLTSWLLIGGGGGWHWSSAPSPCGSLGGGAVALSIGSCGGGGGVVAVV